MSGRDESSRSNKTSVFTEDNSKLEWMYKSGSELLNREEYLMGKSIDKQFEKLDEEEKRQRALPGVTVPKNHVEHECIPFSIRAYRHLQSDEQVDIQRKIIEDPLMQIRQREMESRRRILENPVKLKELHRLLKQEQSSKKTKSSKKSKKKKDKKSHKKKKKRRHSSDSSSSSDEDLDKLLAKKYRQMREEFGPNDGTFDLKKLIGKDCDKSSKDDSKSRKPEKQNSSESVSDSDGRSDSANGHQKLKTTHKGGHEERNRSEGNRDRVRRRTRSPVAKRHSRSRSRESNFRKDSSSRRNRDSSERGMKKLTRAHDDKSSMHLPVAPKNNPFRQNISRKCESSSSKNKRRSSSVDYSSTSSEHDDSQDDRAPRKHYGLVSADGKQIELKRSNESTSSRITHGEFASTSQPAKQQPGKTYRRERLTDEEKEQRYREMMVNAEWRDKERKEQARKYREEGERERAEHKDFDKNFINKAMHKAMQAHTSVESRLKSNINNIQRSGRAMETNFARR